MTLRSVALAVAITVSLAGDLCANPRTVHIDSPRLDITVPEGFADFTDFEGSRPDPRVVATLRRPPVVVQVVRLDGELPQRPLVERERAELRLSDPFAFVDHVEAETALGFPVECLVGTAVTPAGRSVVRFAVGVPTVGDTVGLTVLAPREREREARGVMRSMLGSLRGPTGWKTPTQRAVLSARPLAGAVVIAGTLGYGLAAITVFRKRPLGDRARSRVFGVLSGGWVLIAGLLVFPTPERWDMAAAQAAALAAVFGWRAATRVT